MNRDVLTLTASTLACFILVGSYDYDAHANDLSLSDMLFRDGTATEEHQGQGKRGST